MDFGEKAPNAISLAPAFEVIAKLQLAAASRNGVIAAPAAARRRQDQLWIAAARIATSAWCGRGGRGPSRAEEEIRPELVIPGW